MPVDRRQFSIMLTVSGGSLLTIGLAMLMVKVFVWLSWEFALPTIVVGLITLIIGYVLRY